MRKKSPGFTLLELLVAFAVAAIALTSFYGVTLTSLVFVDITARQTRALAIARSRLAMLDPPNAPAAGLSEGDETGAYHWVLTVVPRQAASPGGVATARQVILYEARITVRFPGGRGRERSVTLDTRRVGVAAQ